MKTLLKNYQLGVERASKMEKPRAGTPHDWEDYEKYLKEFEKNGDK